MTLGRTKQASGGYSMQQSERRRERESMYHTYFRLGELTLGYDDDDDDDSDTPNQ